MSVNFSVNCFTINKFAVKTSIANGCFKKVRSSQNLRIAEFGRDFKRS